MKINKLIIGLAASAGLLASCKNAPIVYPNFSYSTVYFASQYPLRTVELGEDLFVDNSLDNQHKVSIKATMGGVYDNKKDVLIDVRVDETLLNNLYFNNNGPKIVAMPTQYYQLASNQIKIPAGSLLGGVEVKLTDAFFADPSALKANYVIPLVMTKVTGADSILKGSTSVPNPLRVKASDWVTAPKDYILYGVKYVNPWHGNYLRRGVDQITPAGGTTSTAVRRTPYVENNQVVNITTGSLTQANLPLSIKNSAGTTVPFTLVLTFADNGTCTVSGNNPASFDITGTGKFVSKGEKNSIGGTDRSAIYLDYTVNFKNLNVTYATKDTLVVRDRGLKAEYFDVVIK
ncbi:DUF5627 domain-containing protein [Mucilaginibacter auburnensis]|uniref:Uncharacterized protein DUF1735 n=1 Tax=Mucilaginibacter auburnensis TaxID=1457233 RepID=A0A2H9VR47_9SPHI|nr:DUF5627 domain-containing protein [Mucilaginibacter auburnensis]PJJ83307.1 uncharacterized protein DUF1735 [Mucilaginibacter auburnensis]